MKHNEASRAELASDSSKQEVALANRAARIRIKSGVMAGRTATPGATMAGTPATAATVSFTRVTPIGKTFRIG